MENLEAHGVVTPDSDQRAAPCGIVVPVRNEAEMLPQTVPALLAATAGDDVRIVWVCNGCQDDSAAVIRSLVGPESDVIEIGPPGKTGALQAGDDFLGDMFPRLYLDADTWLRPGDLARLFAPLMAGQADLTAASHAFDLSRASRLSGQMSICWLALPFATEAAFLGAVAISQAGRAQWDIWPDVIADDMFMTAHVPSARKKIVLNAIATTRPPKRFQDWVAIRARWIRGERELLRMGFSLPEVEGQRAALVTRLLDPRTCVGAAAFILARIVAGRRARRSRPSYWQPRR